MYCLTTGHPSESNFTGQCRSREQHFQSFCHPDEKMKILGPAGNDVKGKRRLHLWFSTLRPWWEEQSWPPPSVFHSLILSHFKKVSGNSPQDIYNVKAFNIYRPVKMDTTFSSWKFWSFAFKFFLNFLLIAKFHLKKHVLFGF